MSLVKVRVANKWVSIRLMVKISNDFGCVDVVQLWSNAFILLITYWPELSLVMSVVYHRGFKCVFLCNFSICLCNTFELNYIYNRRL